MRDLWRRSFVPFVADGLGLSTYMTGVETADDAVLGFEFLRHGCGGCRRNLG